MKPTKNAGFQFYNTSCRAIRFRRANANAPSRKQKLQSAKFEPVSASV
jgi:hypothetical protein